MHTDVNILIEITEAYNAVEKLPSVAPNYKVSPAEG